MFELETNEGEILTFATEKERTEYVISRMIENGQLNAVGRDESGDLLLQKGKDK